MYTRCDFISAAEVHNSSLEPQGLMIFSSLTLEMGISAPERDLDIIKGRSELGRYSQGAWLTPPHQK